MIIHPAQFDLWIIAPIVFGILTLFGRKGKKEDKRDEEREEKVSATQKPVQQGPPPQKPFQPGPAPTSPAQTPPSSYRSDFSPSPLPASPEETSLNKLLQSLLQDVPFNPPSEGESSTSPTSTPDWVPPRATPPSRPMVLVPGGKGEKVLAPVEPKPSPPSPKTSKPVEPEPRPSTETGKPSVAAQIPLSTETSKPQEPERRLIETIKPSPPAPPPRLASTSKSPEPEPSSSVETMKPAAPSQPKVTKLREQEAEKPTKPEKPERQEAKPQVSTSPSKSVQTFDHIFDITQGTLKKPGLVIINGPSGSGKTSLASNLAGASLKTGTPCLMITFDQSVASLREKAKQTGWDATQYESQFRLLVVDGYSAQSDSFSLEPYYVEKPSDLDNVEETILKNCQVFMSSNVEVILDSLTGLASKTSSKEFLSKFQDFTSKMKEAGATLIVTLDETRLTKDVTGPLEDMASCVIDLQRDSENNGQLRVRKLNGAVAKSELESFEIDPSNGLLFS